MKLIYPILPDGRFKALTLSFDDGRVQDRRLVTLLNRCGIKATFNLNSGEQGETASPCANMRRCTPGMRLPPTACATPV